MKTETTQTGAARLAAWHDAQCDGEWEHGNGIKIETTDNPGWLVKIDIGAQPYGKGKRDGFSWEVAMGQLWGYDEGTCDLEGLLTLLADVLEGKEAARQALADARKG